MNVKDAIMMGVNSVIMMGLNSGWDNFAYSRLPNVYPIVKGTVVRICFYGENLSDAIKVTIISRTINKWVIENRSITDSFSDFFDNQLENYPRVQNILNYSLTQQAISCARDTVVEKISNKIAQKI